MPDDVFKVHHNDEQSQDKPTWMEQTVRPQPRLVGKSMLVVAPLIAVLLAINVNTMAEPSLAGVNESATGWRVTITLIALIPLALLALMPVIQRRHLERPQPFYRYCKWASVMMVVGVPVLWVLAWVLGVENAVDVIQPIFFVIPALSCVVALYPVGARQNHAAWLRHKNSPPPSPAY